MNKKNRSEKTLVGPVISNLPVAIIVVNKDRRVMLANKAAEFISGKTEGEMFNLRGGDVLGCIHAHDDPEGCGYGSSCQGCQIRDAVINAFKERSNKNLLDTHLVLQEFGKRDLKVSATYINIDDIEKEIIEIERRKNPGRRKSDLDKELVIVAVEDVTEFKRKERLAAAIETVGAACHELNNPLQAITGYLSIMRMELDEDDIDKKRFREMIDKMEHVADRINEVTVKLMNIKVYETKKYLHSRILDVDKSAKEDESP